MRPAMVDVSFSAPHWLNAPLGVEQIKSHGIPAFWVPAEGRSCAGLVFRSGPALEPLPLNGITHLIEHLVMNSVGAQPHAIPHVLESDMVDFAVEGDQYAVEAFLASVTRSITSVPVEALGELRGSVRAESEMKPPGVREQLLRLRFGSVGVGSNSFEEYGTRKAGHRQIANWAARYLHKSNVALWYSGPPLGELGMRLAGGPPVSRGELFAVPIPTPSAANGMPGQVGLSYIAPRCRETLAAAFIARNRANLELVDVRKACTNLKITTERVGTDFLQLMATCECAPGREDEVARVLLWVFECLALAPPSIEEVNAYRNSIANDYYDSSKAPLLAREAAIAYLSKTGPVMWEPTLAQLQSLNSEGVQRVVHEALRTLILVAPRDCAVLSDPRLYSLSKWSPDPVPGARVRPIKSPNEPKPNRHLFLSPQGISIQENGQITSVRFSECVMIVRGDNDYREIISRNGSIVRFAPALWEHGVDIVERIDRELPHELVVSLTTGLPPGVTERRRWRRR